MSMSDEMALGFMVRDELSAARGALKTVKHLLSKESQVQRILTEAIELIEVAARRTSTKLYEVRDLDVKDRHVTDVEMVLEKLESRPRYGRDAGEVFLRNLLKSWRANR